MNYIGEVCINIEELEINSEKLSDKGLITVFERWKKLKRIDLAACPRFQGSALYYAQYFNTKQLQIFVVSFKGEYLMEKLKEKL